jgi:hypothetical protein
MSSPRPPIPLLYPSHDNKQFWFAIASLEEIVKDTPETLQTLIGLIPTIKNETIRQYVRNRFIEQTTNDEYNPQQAVESLEQIGKNNSEAIQALIPMIQTAKDEDTRRQAAESLGQIDKNNSVTIQALIEIIQTAKDEDTRRQAVHTLGQIGKNNSEAIQVLIWLIQTTKSKYTYRLSTASLTQIIQDDGLNSAVSSLKNNLANQAKENDFESFECCYSVIWHCAQNMTYPAFYQAWHQQEEVEKTTISDSQSLNQADLPQRLQSAIANDSQLSQIIHLICIDGSQFIEPDRPAAEIYDQMLDQNCPECSTVPDTMPALKLYWNSLRRNSDKQPVLVFYASSTEPYSEAFFTVLSKFGREICVITEQRFEHIPLKFFSRSQTIEDVVKWIREKVMEE